MITVVMLTRNRREEAQRTLERVRALPERPEVVVVDNGSSDGTAATLRASHPDVRVMSLEHNIGTGARNVGVGHARTPYVAFCDDDSWWAAGALARAVELFEAHPRLGLVAARVQVGEDERMDDACAAMRASPLRGRASHPGTPVLGFLACASVIRRDAFLSVGGFRSELGIGGEEQLLAVDLATAGWQVAYVDELIAHHHPSVRRDERTRDVVMTRNALWFTWLRRPARMALRSTLAAIGRAAVDRSHAAALAQAARGVPWVVRARRAVPAEVERDLRLIERSRTLRSATSRRRRGAVPARADRAGRGPQRTG